MLFIHHILILKMKTVLLQRMVYKVRMAKISFFTTYSKGYTIFPFNGYSQGPSDAKEGNLRNRNSIVDFRIHIDFSDFKLPLPILNKSWYIHTMGHYAAVKQYTNHLAVLQSILNQASSLPSASLLPPLCCLCS